MSPEQLDEARGKETLRRLVDSGKVYCHEDIAALGARLARENWTPPEPVDPDILAFREWMSNYYGSKGWSEEALASRLGHCDGSLAAKAYLAGARMAREQAKPLAQYLQDRADRDDAEADRILAEYRGEA